MISVSEGSVLSRLFKGRSSCICFCVELVKLLAMHPYSVDIFSYYGPSGILGSDRKHKSLTALVGARAFTRDLTIPHLDLSHFALCIMGN